MNAVHQPRPSPDRGCLIALVQPLLRRDDVHAPQSPVVAVGGVGVLLHLKRVVLDVVYGGQDDAGVILLHPGQNRFSPVDLEKRKKLRGVKCRLFNWSTQELQSTAAKGETGTREENKAANILTLRFEILILQQEQFGHEWLKRNCNWI